MRKTILALTFLALAGTVPAVMAQDVEREQQRREKAEQQLQEAQTQLEFALQQLRNAETRRPSLQCGHALRAAGRRECVFLRERDAANRVVWG